MSLRTRLFLTCSLVVVVCLSIFALSMAVVLQGYRDRLIMEKLDDVARPIAVQVISLLRGQTTLAALVTDLQAQSTENDVYILLGDAEGDIVRQIAPDARRPIEEPVKGLPRNPAKAATGTFTAATGRTFVYSAYPLGALSTLNQAKATTMIIATPRSGFVTIWASLLVPSVFAGLVALIVSLVVAILLARSIYGPIYRLTAAANGIALGDYGHPVPMEGPEEIKGLAASFNRMSEKVKETQEGLRRFVADVSHQLKTPLTSIQGFSQAIVDGTAGDDATRLRAAKVINEESVRMRRQVEELLELARLQSGQLTMSREPVDISELLGYCREILEVQAQDKFIAVSVESAPGTSVAGDADRLEQVFCNLLDNAIKASPPKGEIKLTAGPDAPGFVAVRVIDKGPGIPPEQLKNLFQRFHQGNERSEPNQRNERSGYGLGLAIAREIIQAHGGTIEVKSEVGKGTEFIVRLPAAIRVGNT